MSEKRRDSKGRILRTGEVQRPDGKYMFRYMDSNGDRQTIYSWKLVSTDKVPEGKRCKFSLRDMEREVERDQYEGLLTVENRDLTVNDLFDSFMDMRTDLRPNTRYSYRCMYDHHVREEIGYRKACTVSFSDIQKLYYRWCDEDHLKFSTIEKMHAMMAQVFGLAVRDRILPANPTEMGLKKLRGSMDTQPEKRHALTEDQQRVFVDYIYSTPNYSRFGPLITVLLGTGMRIGEALGLCWSNCDFEQNLITVDHAIQYKPAEGGGHEYRVAPPKTKSGMRLIPMLPEVKEALYTVKSDNLAIDAPEFIVGGYSGFIFLNSKGKVYSPSAIYDSIQSAINDYNREEYFVANREKREPIYLPKFSAHNLRHTFCTRFCENEQNIKVIQDVMGHSNFSTTMDIYNEATMDRKKDSFENLRGKMKIS